MYRTIGDRGARSHAAARQETSCAPSPPPPQWGGLDLNSSNRGCARLGSGVVPPLGVVEKEVAVLIVLVRRYRCCAGSWMMRSRTRLGRRRAQPRCAVCPQAFLVRCLTCYWVLLSRLSGVSAGLSLGSAAVAACKKKNLGTGAGPLRTLVCVDWSPQLSLAAALRCF